MSNYTVALYLRLSDDDCYKENESMSIKNQRIFLQQYIENHSDFVGSKIVEFVDDGYSGLTFNRPGIQALLDLVKKQRINCIIVKDISRFGRNFIDVCDYTEQIFPFWNVRFISVGDNYDSTSFKGTTSGMGIPFLSLRNQLYSMDISSKIKSNLKTKMQNGTFIGNYAFYGYKKSDKDKNKLVIDTEAAKVVRRIFAMSKNGLNATQIAQTLNFENIPSPAKYKKTNGCKMKWNIANDEMLWSPHSIKNILTNEGYTGKLIRGKHKRIDIGVNRCKTLPNDQCIIIPNAFDAIVTENEFYAVQHKRRCDIQIPHNTNQPLYGILKCGHCGRSLHKSKSKEAQYFCDYKTKTIGIPCMERIKEKDILDALLLSINHQIELSKNYKLLSSFKNKNNENKKLIQMELKHLCDEKDRLLLEYLDGKIPQNDFIYRKNVLVEKINKYQDELDILTQNAEIDNNYHSALKQCNGIVEITKEVVNSLVKGIYVYNENTLKIIWKYQDEYKKLLNYSKCMNGNILKSCI
jgi:site-specific DNA recombinase